MSRKTTLPSLESPSSVTASPSNLSSGRAATRHSEPTTSTIRRKAPPPALPPLNESALTHDTGPHVLFTPFSPHVDLSPNIGAGPIPLLSPGLCGCCIALGVEIQIFCTLLSAFIHISIGPLNSGLPERCFCVYYRSLDKMICLAFTFVLVHLSHS